MVIESSQILNGLIWLEKFRKYLITMFAILIAATIASYYYSDFIIAMITKPIGEMHLYFITPAEGFITKIKVALIVAFIATFPIHLFFIISHISAAFSKGKKRVLYYLAIPFSTLAFWGGILFGYMTILPSSLRFLIQVGNEIMSPLLSANSYINFVMFLLVVIGLVFELPILLVALSRIHIVTSAMLRKKRKIAIIVIMIVLAILTPSPDAFTLGLVSLPMITLYEISIWAIFILEKKEVD